MKCALNGPSTSNLNEVPSKSCLKIRLEELAATAEGWAPLFDALATVAAACFIYCAPWVQLARSKMRRFTVRASTRLNSRSRAKFAPSPRKRERVYGALNVRSTTMLAVRTHRQASSSPLFPQFHHWAVLGLLRLFTSICNPLNLSKNTRNAEWKSGFCRDLGRVKSSDGLAVYELSRLPNLSRRKP